MLRLSKGQNTSIATQRGSVLSYSEHKAEPGKNVEASFGLKDKFTENLDIRLEYSSGGAIHIFINGHDEEVKREEEKSLVKERLAAKPFKFVTRSQRYLSIGYDLSADNLTLLFNGEDVSRLPAP